MFASGTSEALLSCFEAKMTVDAGAIVISVLMDGGCGAKRWRSERKPALGTLSFRSASAMSQAVYSCKAWSCSLVAPDEVVAIIRLEVGVVLLPGVK